MVNRSINSEISIRSDVHSRLNAAQRYAERGIDQRSEVGVGCVLTVAVDKTPTTDQDRDVAKKFSYGGFNIAMSGMQVKLHAEQLALYQAICDLQMQDVEPASQLDEVIVVSTEQDGRLKCGHCLQVMQSAADYFGWDPSEVDYIAGKEVELENVTDDKKVTRWEITETTLEELFSGSYIE